MKKILCVTMGIVFVWLCSAHEQGSSGQPIYVTVNNQTSSTSHATAISYALCKQWVSSYYEVAQETGKNIWYAIQDHVWQHKLRYALYTVVGGYAALIVYVHHINYFINNQNCWHNWTDTITLDSFYAVDHCLLAEKLHYAIQKRYFNQFDPANKIAPIIRFFIDIQEEKNVIDRYCYITDWLEALGIGKLPCIHLPNKEKLMQAKRHVLFLEQLATAWCLMN